MLHEHRGGKTGGAAAGFNSCILTADRPAGWKWRQARDRVHCVRLLQA